MTRESRLQRELKQKRPFRSRAHEATVGLLRTADMVRREFAQVVEPRGITIQQFNVLRILRGAGQAGLPTLEIAERMIEETPGITRLLDRLEKKKLVRRKRCDADRRQVLCWISSEGLALLAALDDPVARRDASLLEALNEPALESLIHSLDAVRAGIQAKRNASK